MSHLAAARIVAAVEAATHVCLLAAVVARRAFGHPGWASVVGPIHGLAFVAWFLVVSVGRDPMRWSWRTTLIALLAAVAPLLRAGLRVPGSPASAA